jgi:uncharacterized membrane protein YebE (DUF533 family)
MSQARLDVVRAMAAMAWSDGRMDKNEMEKLRVLGKRMGLDVSERSKMEGFLRSRPSLDQVDFSGLNEKERQAFYMLAVHYAYLDKRVKPGEKKMLDTLAELLMVPLDVRTTIDENAQAMAQAKK